MSNSTQPAQAHVTQGQAANEATLSVAEQADHTNEVAPVPAGGVERGLPQVQTAEPQAQSAQSPRAVARLRGDIVEAPPHQARNDDNQSSIH
jgi:hypothetical protein